MTPKKRKVFQCLSEQRKRVLNNKAQTWRNYRERERERERERKKGFKVGG